MKTNKVDNGLLNIFKRNIHMAIKINMVVCFFIFITHEYPRNLATIDFTLTLLFIVFILGVFPFMLAGKIPIFYQNNYENKAVFNMIFINIILTSVLRFPITYGILFLNTYFSKTQIDVDKYFNIFVSYVYNPIFNIFSILLFSYYIYYLFYQRKIKLIKLISENIFKIKKKQNQNKIWANTQIQLNIQAQPNSQNLESKINNNVSVTNNDMSIIDNNDTSVIRRRSRS